jgi:hypothetical protein
MRTLPTDLNRVRSSLVHLPGRLAAQLLGPSLVFSWGSVFDDPPAICDGNHGDGWFCDECDL